MNRVLHVAAAYATHEGMSRTATELARRVTGEHGLCTNRLRTEAPAFDATFEVGGSMTFFPATRAAAVRAAVDRYRPDVVHLHGGILTPLFARGPVLRPPVVASVYGWTTPPSRHELLGSSWSELRCTPAAQARVLVNGVLPAWAMRRALGPGGPVRALLAHDAHLARRLSRASGVPVRLAEIGPGVDNLRATPSFERPVVAFAGRAESARGADTLIDAMPEVLRQHPGARLRLMLLPSPQLPELADLVARSTARHAIDIVTEPVVDLRVEFAMATVGVFPFKFDHTTAMAPPLTVTEAMSVGLPVVVSAVRCMLPVVEARRGTIVVPPRDSGAVARAIVAALEPARWAALSEDAVRAVDRRWNWGNAARVASALYEEVLAGAG
ncbi:MAG TPA: glycosyltransferase family 4 protein [Acidimicrobiales bacterium]|jgi:alpha-maltose-1-phosphate synthase|nr:glycosyltransferase family 4 protein [Acidimicrobiales bacterium]